MTIETFWMVFGSAGSSLGRSSVSVMGPISFLDAAAGLRDAADLRGELRRALGKERVELLDRDARLLAERPDRRGLAGCEEPLAHEADNLPVAGRQLRDPVLAGDLLGQLFRPVLGMRQESLGIPLDGKH